MDVLVLAGGPDREREVSLHSGVAVAAALRAAGHRVSEGDLQPEDASTLDLFVDHLNRVEATSGGGASGGVFPAMHGKWGEGGGAQSRLEQAGVAYVGCRPAAAAWCMDKAATKRVLAEHGISTPAWAVGRAGEPCPQLPGAGDVSSLPGAGAGVVLKPVDEGSSLDLALCRTAAERDAAWAELSTRNQTLLVERLIEGKELTVGWVEGLGDSSSGGGVLPPIWIRPAAEFYDYDAKYERHDTVYAFDLQEPPEVEQRLREITRQCVAALGVRHLCRVDFMLDRDGTPWVLEVNTMPGFTDHSLLPKAAAHAGVPMPALCDHLVRLAADGD